MSAENDVFPPPRDLCAAEAAPRCAPPAWPPPPVGNVPRDLPRPPGVDAADTPPPRRDGPPVQAVTDSPTPPPQAAWARPRPDALAVDLPTAAAMLGVHPDTVRREIDRGKLKALKIGRLWRVRRFELDAYLKRAEEAQKIS